MSDLQSCLMSKFQQANKDEAGIPYFAVIGTFLCWRGPHFMPVDRRLTVLRTGEDLAQVIEDECKRLQDPQGLNYTAAHFSDFQ